jgi:hypothetical protein
MHQLPSVNRASLKRRRSETRLFNSTGNKRDHGESDSEEHLPVKKARSEYVSSRCYRPLTDFDSSGALIRVYLGAITGCDVKYAYVTWGNSIEVFSLSFDLLLD